MYHTDQFDLLKARISRILALHPPHPGSSTWYVDQAGGSDTTGDGSEDAPYATITFCLTQASVMDTIIAWGTFTEDSIAPVTGQRLIGLGNGLTVLNKTTNTNSGIISSNPGIEVTGFIIDGTASTGHGIELQNGNDAHIHHNVIRDITGAYDGIDKGIGGVITGAKIHHNIIIDGAGGGIGMVNVTESEFERNICLRNAGEGIILNASCDNNVLRENICNENNEGIELQGDNNEVVDNVMLNNTVANYVDTGANNSRSDLQKKPEWGTPVVGVSTPVGIPALTTAFQFNPPAPGRVALTLDISNYVGGDTCLIYVQVMVDALNWRNVGYINIANGVIVDFIGPSAPFYSPGAALLSATFGAVQFDIHIDQILALRLQHNQTVGGAPRGMPYHYNYFQEI